MKKEGKVWIKISGDFATFLNSDHGKTNIKSKHITSGQIRSNTSKTHSKGGKTIEYENMETNDGWLIGRRPYFYRNPVFCSAGEPPGADDHQGDAFQNAITFSATVTGRSPAIM